MNTIALRFFDNFAPPEGTISAHKKYIQENGYVWYGKLGSPVSDRVCKDIMSNTNPRILLIHSGKSSRYWAYIDKISKEKPEQKDIPSYYRDQADNFHTWFRIIRFEEADRNVLSSCFVTSSGAALSTASRSSMSPYFIIKYEGK